MNELQRNELVTHMKRLEQGLINISELCLALKTFPLDLEVESIGRSTGGRMVLTLNDSLGEQYRVAVEYGVETFVGD